MSKKLLIFFIVTSLALVFLVGATYVFTNISDDFVSANTNVQTPLADEIRLFGLIQKYRSENDLKPFNWNETLCIVADKRVVDLQTNFSHDRDEEAEWLTIHADGLNYWSENIVMIKNPPLGLDVDVDLLDWWLNSPPHKAELLNPKPTETCIRCLNNRCIQIFGSY